MTPTPAPQSLPKLKAALMKAAAKKRRAKPRDRLESDGQTLSATGVAAIEFTSERPSLSESQKDRVAAIIADLDKMSPLERNLIKSLVTEAQSEPPNVLTDMPIGTEPDDLVKASLYYSLEAEEAERRRNRRFQVATIVGGAIGFLVTWGLLVSMLW
jgi:hypothetical protein